MEHPVAGDTSRQWNNPGSGSKIYQFFSLLPLRNI